MSQYNLPELPEPFMPLDHMPHLRAAWAEQMHAYALAALSEQGAGEAPVVAPTPSPQSDHSPDGGKMVGQQAGAVTELKASIKRLIDRLNYQAAVTMSGDTDKRIFAANQVWNAVDDCTKALAAFEAKKAGGDK